MAVPTGRSVKSRTPDPARRVFLPGILNNLQATANAFRNLWHTLAIAEASTKRDRLFRGRMSDSVRRRVRTCAAFEVENAIVDHPAVSGSPSPLSPRRSAETTFAPRSSSRPAPRSSRGVLRVLHNNLPTSRFPATSTFDRLSGECTRQGHETRAPQRRPARRRVGLRVAGPEPCPRPAAFRSSSANRSTT